MQAAAAMYASQAGSMLGSGGMFFPQNQNKRKRRSASEKAQTHGGSGGAGGDGSGGASSQGGAGGGGAGVAGVGMRPVCRVRGGASGGVERREHAARDDATVCSLLSTGS